MTRKSLLTSWVALGLLATVVGTYSLVSAGDDELSTPPRVEQRDAGGDAARIGARDAQPPRLARGERPDDPLPDEEGRARAEREPRERAEAVRPATREPADDARPPIDPGAARGARPELLPILPGRRVPPEGVRPPLRPENVEQFGRMVDLVERTRHTCFDPELAAIIAVGGLKEDVPRKGEEIIEDLERTLNKVKTLGIRNAVRMILRDMYKQRGEHEKVLEHVRAMVAENDAAIQARAAAPERPGRPEKDRP